MCARAAKCGPSHAFARVRAHAVDTLAAAAAAAAVSVARGRRRLEGATAALTTLSACSSHGAARISEMNGARMPTILAQEWGPEVLYQLEQQRLSGSARVAPSQPAERRLRLAGLAV